MLEENNQNPPRATKKTKEEEIKRQRRGRDLGFLKRTGKTVSRWMDRKGKREWMMGNFLSAVIHISRKLLFHSFIHSFIHPLLSLCLSLYLSGVWDFMIFSSIFYSWYVHC
jgi:hypothetical protein